MIKMANEIQPVKPLPTRYERIRRLPAEIYQKVEPYVPHTSEEGKGVLYAGIGLGVAGMLGLIGYGIYSGVGSSGQALASCTSQYDKEVSLWNKYNLQFLQENIANNVPYSSAQNTYLQNIVNQENKIAQTCFKDNWVASSAATISEAFALAIVIYFGARAYAYIRKKGYLKPPKTGSGGNADTPAGSTARAQMGIIDYERTSGVIPPSWNNSGSASVNDISSIAKTQVQTFTTQMVQLNLMDATVATEIVAAETAAIEESSLLVLAVLA